MKVLINYADAPWKPAQNYATKKAYSVGKVDKVLEYGPENIDKKYREEHEYAFIPNNKRVGKYGLWRPHILMDSYKKLREGDYLIYCDSGAFFVKPVDLLIDFMEKQGTPFLIFDSGNKEYQMTKRDIFVYMGLDTEEYANSTQRASTFFVIKKCDKCEAILKEFYKLTIDAPFLFTDEKNRLGKENYKGFIDTRHNQSVLSLLTKKYGIPSFRSPAQRGMGTGIIRIVRNKKEAKIRGEYPTVFFLHRSKKVTIVSVGAVIMQTYFPRTFRFIDKVRKSKRNAIEKKK